MSQYVGLPSYLHDLPTLIYPPGNLVGNVADSATSTATHSAFPNIGLAPTKFPEGTDYLVVPSAVPFYLGPPPLCPRLRQSK